MDDNFDLMIRLELPGSVEFLELIGPCVRTLVDHLDFLPAEDRTSLAYNLELATYETCTNIVYHAYAGVFGRIDLSFALEQARTFFSIAIRDFGKAFDLSSQDIQLPKPEQDTGYGLYLIHQLVDEVQYSSSCGTNEWRLLKRV